MGSSSNQKFGTHRFERGWLLYPFHVFIMVVTFSLMAMTTLAMSVLMMMGAAFITFFAVPIW